MSCRDLHPVALWRQKRVADVEQLQLKATAQDASILEFQSDFRAAVDREARADLMEKRKQTEAELEALHRL